MGKTKRNFRQEAFAESKVARYMQFLADCGKGTPVMFLLAAQARPGVANGGHIQDLERFLIQVGVVANPDLLNVQGTGQADWYILGVIRSKGKPSSAAVAFKRMMKLTPPSKQVDNEQGKVQVLESTDEADSDSDPRPDEAKVSLLV